MDKLINQIQNKTEKIFTANGITYAAVFGSFAKGESNSDSDIDILFDYDHSKSFSMFKMLEVKDQLEKVLNYKVDFVPINGIKASIIKEISDTSVTIYGQK